MLNTGVECGMEEFGATFPTFCHIEVVCGLWPGNDGELVSDFGEISYPFSTIDYEYRAYQERDVSTGVGITQRSDSTIDCYYYSQCCKHTKHYNGKILWKYGCPGSFRYEKNHIGRKYPARQYTCSMARSDANIHLHDASLEWLPNFLKGILLMCDIGMALLSVFVDPICIISICVMVAFRFMCYMSKALMGGFNDFVWDVWLGKYPKAKNSKFRPTLIVVLLAICSVRPVFIVGSSDCPLGDACESEFYSGLRSDVFNELPSTADSLLEQAKRMRFEYAKLNKERRKRQRRERYEKDRTCAIQYQTSYDNANKERILKRKADRYRKNSASVIQYQTSYNNANKETISKRKADRYRKNSASAIQYQTSYDNANKETISKRKADNYKKKKSIVGSLRETNRSTRDCEGTSDLECFLQFLDSDHREKIMREHIERIGGQMDSTSVSGDVNKQRSNICVVCDEIIFGAEPVRQMSKVCLLENSMRLCVSQYENHFGIQLHTELLKQYQVSMALLVSEILLCIFKFLTMLASGK